MDLYYKQFEARMLEMVEERRVAQAQGVEYDDLFSTLIKASDAEEGEAALTSTELLSNMYIILLAGHETTGKILFKLRVSGSLLTGGPCW